MTGLVPIIVLIFLFLAGLLLIPFGLPGLWVMVLGVIGYAALTGFAEFGWVTLGFVLSLAIVGEVLEAWLGFRFARRYGGSARAGWGAIAGGLVGAVLGTPLPLIGNVVGAFLGAFVGATLLELTRKSRLTSSMSAGWGAVLGRAAGAAVKIALGIVIAVLGTYAALGAL